MSYTNISNFDNNTLRNVLRDDILNPLINQHNTLTTEVVDLKSTSTSHESRLEVLETAGGSGYDDTAINDRVDAVEVDVAGNTARIEDLEAAGGVSSNHPTKWYVLPLFGQSNMQGWGERDMPLENNPRIKQLATFNSSETVSNETWTVTKTNSNYGDRFREFRPVDNTNMTLIPATPCLDSAKNKFWEMKTKNKVGGMVSPGSYIAEAILPYIPRDYGIIILDCSKGSSGFGDMHAVGTYDATNKRASLEATKWSMTSPLGKMFIDRLKHCLDLNPENKLLPFIWCQGENDVQVQQHFDRSKEFFLSIRSLIETSYLSRLPKGLISNFRVVCFGTTRKALTKNDNDVSTRGISIYDWEIDYESTPGAGDDPWGIHDFTNSRSNFDNYAYLMDDPAFKTGSNKSSQVIMVRADIQRDGYFTETAAEEGQDAGGALIGYSADWHFSTNTITNFLPSALLNAIGYYTNYLHKPFVTSGPWTRDVRGRFGQVSTDNVKFVFDNSVTKVTTAPTIYHKLPAAQDVLRGYSVTSDVDTVTASDLAGTPPVASFSDNTNHVTYTADADKSTSFTLSFLFKDTSGDAENTNVLLSGASGKPFPRMWHKNGSWLIAPLFDGTDASIRTKNFMIHKHLHGGWKGGRGDWQHLAIVYDKVLDAVHFYFNGCLVESVVDVPSITLSDIHLGKDSSDANKAFVGNISSFALYEEALSSGEINYLNKVALKNTLPEVLEYSGFATADQVVAVESRITDAETEITALESSVSSLTRWHLEV